MPTIPTTRRLTPTHSESGLVAAADPGWSASGYETPMDDGSGLSFPFALPASPMSAPAPLCSMTTAAAAAAAGAGVGAGFRRARTDFGVAVMGSGARVRRGDGAGDGDGGNGEGDVLRRTVGGDGGEGGGVNPASLESYEEGNVQGCRGPRKVGLRDRIGCFQWTWFTMTMATGGIANVMHSIPYKAQWLTGIGLAFFFFNLCLFVINCIMISLRFYWRPGSFVDSFTDQFESLFISAIIVSTATILITITQYGIPHTGPWLLAVMEALFWIYIGASILISAGLYLTLWSTQAFPIHTMTPVWVFPAYPLLLSAPFGGNLIAAASSTGHLPSLNAVPVALASVTVQGTGFLISFMVCAAFLYRLMTQKLPRDHQRPGVFISIGPGGFTAAGLVQLGSQTTAIFPADFMGTEHAVFVLRVLAYMAGLWLWGLSLWFFLVSVGSLWKYLRPESKGKLRFQMTWFSFVFPNTALVTATEALGVAFNSHGLQIFGCVLTVCLVLVWLLVFTKMLRCLWRRELPTHEYEAIESHREVLESSGLTPDRLWPEDED